MAQTRLRNYLHKLPSFDHNLFNMVLHSSGRFMGFDTISAVGSPPTRNFELRHTKTGVTYKDTNNTTHGPCAAYMTPQGVLIMENAAITGFTIDTNAGNSETRYDIIIAEHNQVQIALGQAATYSIIKGTIGSSVKPILTDPLKQILIGTIEIPPNAVDIGDCSWQKAKCPDSGDGEDARLTEPNIFRAFQGLYESQATYNIPTISHVSGGITAGLLELDNDGNTYRYLPVGDTFLDGIRMDDIPLQAGYQISIFINDKVTLRESAHFLASYNSKGYRRLKINQGFGNIDAAGGLGALGIKPATGEIWEIKMTFTDDKWQVFGIGGANSLSTFKRGMCIEWFGNVNANFDINGMGMNLMSGFHICNGLANTPDTRGRIRFMGVDVPSTGATVIDPGSQVRIQQNNGNAGGTNLVLTQPMLPSVQFPITDNHRHEMLFKEFRSDENEPGVEGQGFSHNDNGDGTQLSDYTEESDGDMTVDSGGNDQAIPFNWPYYTLVHCMKL